MMGSECVVCWTVCWWSVGDVVLRMVSTHKQFTSSSAKGQIGAGDCVETERVLPERVFVSQLATQPNLGFQCITY